MIVSTTAQMAGESDHAYLGYCCWESLSKPRTMDAAYTEYLKQRQLDPKSTGKTKRASSAFHTWRDKFRWDERADAHDRAAAERAVAAMRQAEADLYLEKIEKYREKTLAASEGLIDVGSHMLYAAKKYIKSNPEITCASDLGVYARGAATLIPLGLEIQSRGLYLDQLMQSFEEIDAKSANRYI
jgi:hypothetical protein